MEPKKTLSKNRIKHLKAQGYVNHSENEITSLAWGNRFAFILCSILVAIAVIFSYLPLLIGLFAITILGVILPYHPFDYIYNYLLAKSFGKPKLPPRSEQLKFACYLASIMLLITIYLFNAEFNLAGYIVGGLLLAVAITVSITDFCLPSAIYNALLMPPSRESNYESNQ